MFYTKLEGIEILIDGVYAKCFNCGKEIEIDSETLHAVLRDGDLYTTQIACCGNIPTVKRIK